MVRGQPDLHWICKDYHMKERYSKTNNDQKEFRKTSQKLSPFKAIYLLVIFTKSQICKITFWQIFSDVIRPLEHTVQCQMKLIMQTNIY